MALAEKYVSVAGGGAHNGTTEADAFTWAEMVTDSATSAVGTRYNIKAGTYSRTTTTDTLGAGSATSPKIYRGYSTVIGDAYLGRTNNNGPLITTNMPVVTYTTGRLVQGAQTIIEGLNMTAATSLQGTLTPGNNAIVHWCSVLNTSTGSANDCAMLGGSTNCWVHDCDVFHTGGSGNGNAMRAPASGMRVTACRMGSTTGIGILLTTVNAIVFIYRNTIFSCGTDAIQATAATVATIVGNTLVGCSSDGISSIAQSNLNTVHDNIITDNTNYAGTFGGAASQFAVASNRTRDNSSGKYLNADDWVTATSWQEVTTDTGGESTDYVDGPGDDYRLVSTSPAVGAGVPYAASIGALQPSTSSSNGGSTAVPSMDV